ncbi:ATP-grasp domain-containing protein [Acidihalobacter prosperus]|uniref:Alpha-L-glutamate ligase n=1 Tax=Acidihalobacter prosperus TaxID=160660 RepID=A0A1A6C1M7_9GAMM|nr:alpha-L-glutamate ligase [Acidihalobacter prosperus]OBS08467.1 alpha-L-glutamate ligase [Acidihalobacter prosperus]
MRLVSFDAFRTLGLPGIHYVKPEHFLHQQALVDAADWVLFPEFWQLGTLVFALRKRIFPSLSSYLLGHDKIEMTRAFQAVAPRHVPETVIAANTPDDADRLWSTLTPPFVAKIPRSSMGEGVSLIESHADWTRYLAATPTIYAQEYLPIDRDLRVVIAGSEVVAAYWRLQSARSFHNNLARGGRIGDDPVPPAAIELALLLARTLGIDHAGFDIAMVGGHPYVLEFNRLFGYQGLNGRLDRLAGAILDHLRTQGDHHGPHDPIRPTPVWPTAA